MTVILSSFSIVLCPLSRSLSLSFAHIVHLTRNLFYFICSKLSLQHAIKISSTQAAKVGLAEVNT